MDSELTNEVNPHKRPSFPMPDSLKDEEAQHLAQVKMDALKEFDLVGAKITEVDQDIPQEINPDLLKDMDPTQAFLLEHAFAGYVNFLKRPIVTDKFTNHNDRANWRKRAEARMTQLDQADGKNQQKRKEVFTEIYKNNKLNANSLFELPGYTEMLLDDPDSLPPGFPIEALRNLSRLKKHFTSKATIEATKAGTGSQSFIENPNPWDTLPLENTVDEKIKFKYGKLDVLKQLDQNVKEIVEFLGKK